MHVKVLPMILIAALMILMSEFVVKRLMTQVCLFSIHNYLLNFFIFVIYLASTAAANCTNGDVRLIGGNNITEGLVEICVSGTWGSICDDSWGAQEMSVVCKQLGLQTAGECLYCSIIYFIVHSLQKVIEIRLFL